jgi:endonuclease YncB( thermonuclease family)
MLKAIRILPIFIPFLTALLNAQDWLKVNRVIDGDSILLTNGERVWLIGGDTPETKHSIISSLKARGFLSFPGGDNNKFFTWH